MPTERPARSGSISLSPWESASFENGSFDFASLRSGRTGVVIQSGSSGFRVGNAGKKERGGQESGRHFRRRPTLRHSRESMSSRKRGRESIHFPRSRCTNLSYRSPMGFACKVWIPAFAGMTRRGFRGDDGMGSVAAHTDYGRANFTRFLSPSSAHGWRSRDERRGVFQEIGRLPLQHR